jgi:hypothetical protein
MLETKFYNRKGEALAIQATDEENKASEKQN